MRLLPVFSLHYNRNCYSILQTFNSMLRFLPDLTYWWRLVALRSSRMRGVHPDAIHFEREPLIPTDGAAQGATQQVVMRCVPMPGLQQAVLVQHLFPMKHPSLTLVHVEDLQHVVPARVPSKASHLRMCSTERLAALAA